MNLKQFATDALLESGDIQTLNISEYVFNYVKADKKIIDIKYPWISEYFLVELNQTNVKLISSLKGFNEFQKSLLLDTFFDLKNDIRWNLYLVFLVEGSYKILEDIPVWDIETDDNYARKYFFTYSDGLMFFKKERFFSKHLGSNELLSTPVKDWYDTLASIQLTGVLTEKFLKNNVINYLDNGIPFLSSEKLEFEGTATVGASTNAQNDDKLRVEKIDEISLGNFRNHCFGSNQIFSPVLVNLIHGSNGCGKTSILEAIEFALTGEIKRLKDFNESFQSEPTVNAVLTSKAGSQTFTSNRSQGVSKEYDRVWYGTPAGREKSTLNNNFNHFNSFNSETAYKFALEESESKNDYSERFSRLLYDDETLAMEKLWRKYREYFDDELDRRDGIYKAKKNQIEKLQKEINDIKGKVNSTNLSELLDKIKYKFNSEFFTQENFYDQCEKIYSSLYALQPSIVELEKRWNESGFISALQVANELSETQAQLNLLNSNFNIKLREKSELENTKAFHSKQINQQLGIRSANQTSLKELVNSLSKWETHKLVLDNNSKAVEYMSLISNKKVIEDKYNKSNGILAKYQTVLKFSLSDIIASQKELDEIIGELDLRRGELAKVEEQIKITSGSIDEIKSLKMQLNRLGLEILQLTDKKNKCPLCGVLHKDKSYIEENINLNNQYTSTEEEYVAKLEKKKADLIKFIASLSQRLEDAIKRQKNYETVLKAIEEINALKMCPVDINKTNSDLLAEIHRFAAHVKDIQIDLKQFSDSIDALNREGFSTESITAAHYFRKNDAHYKAYNANPEGKTFDIYLSLIRQVLLSKTEDITKTIDTHQGKIKEIDFQLSVIPIKELQNKIMQTKEHAFHIEKLLADYRNLEIYFNFTENGHLSPWFTLFKEVLLKIDVAMSHLRASKKLDEKLEQIKAYQLELKLLAEQISRGKHALNKFNSLKCLNNYSIDFIKSNIKRIDYFFKALHTPREFKTLEVSREGIIAIREKDQKPVRMYQMSTGQRISLALAIMFCLHIAAPRAPKLLLLDEPVANMDDLHLLNLIDILREFALQQVQVIFTTANPDVAGIFRRKFSFFGPEFQHYELIRKNDDFTEILTLVYSPDSEATISLESVS